MTRGEVVEEDLAGFLDRFDYVVTRRVVAWNDTNQDGIHLD
jgi:hypothetical protein